VKRTRYGPLHVLYLAAWGVAGWIWLYLATEGLLSTGGLDALFPSPAVAGAFLALGLTAQLLSFDVGAHLRVSLDSAFYVSAMLLLGPVPAAWVVASAMAVDTLRNFIERQLGRPGNPPRPWRHEIAALTYNTGGTVMVVLGATRIFGLTGPADEMTRLQWPILYTLPLLALLFIGIHYAITLVSLWTQGQPVWATLRKILLPTIGVEAMLIPLSMVLVMIYREGDPFSFMLLGATFLLVNLVIHKLVEIREQLHNRVSELKALNNLGRAVGSSLQTEQVLETVVQETLRLQRCASAALLAVRRNVNEKPVFAITSLERDQRHSEHRSAPVDEGLLGYVVDRKEPLRLGNVMGQGARFGEIHDPLLLEARSFLGLPLIAGEEVIGVLAVVSPERGQFTEDTARVVGSIALEASVAVQNAHLFELATEDGLTRLFVRRYFDQRLIEEWHRARRYGGRFALILADLDDFKEINDEHGHPAGDVVLREFSARTIESMRAGDIPARYGGEEFAMLLARANANDARRVAERLRQAVAAMRMQHGGVQLTITASFGIASFPDCGQDDSVEEVFQKADSALYLAKSMGKNRVELWTRDSLDWEGEVSGVIQLKPSD